MPDTPINDTGSDESKRFCGKPGKSGPPKGNGNALRHGLRAGKLPRDCAYLENRLNAFRREIETAVLAAKGEITLTDAGLIQSCLRWERHAGLAQRWLTKQGDKLKPVELLQFSREIAKASSERDKSLAALALNRNVVRDMWSAVDSMPSEGVTDGT